MRTIRSNDGIVMPFLNEDSERNWKWLLTSGCRYLSWGVDKPVVLIYTICRESPFGLYHAIYMGAGEMELIREFRITNLYDYHCMIERLTEWNYHTLNLCPVVRIEMDSQS
jgi:hypothetical protein